MKTLLDTSTLEEVKKRLNQLTPESQRGWGKMDVAQMMAHLSKMLEIALGDHKPPRSLAGRLIGGFIRAKAYDDSPLPRNSPTDNSIRITETKRFSEEKVRLSNLLERFNKAGKTGMTTHPHPFFGSLTPEQWGMNQFKHVSYHLEQFGV